MTMRGTPCLQAATLVLLLGHTAASKVAVGRSFSLILDSTTGAVQGAGKNRYGQLGHGSYEDAFNQTEVLLPEGERVKDVAAGAFHSLFVSETGIAYAAGRNNFGQLGLAAVTEIANPLEVTRGVKAVAAGYAFSLFLMEDGSVQAAGLNNAGQLGDGSTDSTAGREMVTVEGVNATAVAAGYDFSYFLQDNGEVFATGQNLGGQLGDGTQEIRLSPVKVLEGVQAVAAGESHGLFMQGSLVFGTGANFDLQIGQAKMGPFASPVEVEWPGAQNVHAGGDSSCIITDSDILVGMGSNRDGQLGLGTEMAAVSATIIDLQGVEDAALGNSHSLFLTMENALFSTGANAYGQLADGTRQQRFEPIQALQFTTSTFTGSSSTQTRTTETTTATVTMSGSVTQTTTVTKTGSRGRQSQPDPYGILSPLMENPAATMAAAGTVGIALGIFMLVRRAQHVEDEEDIEISEVSRP